MKTFQKKLNDFFKWVKGTELVQLEDIDVSEDPVRPELSLEWRKDFGRTIFGLKFEENIEGIVCVAFTNDVPQSVRELELMSENAEGMSEFSPEFIPQIFRIEDIGKLPDSVKKVKDGLLVI